jgi:hypothetical protein
MIDLHMLEGSSLHDYPPMAHGQAVRPPGYGSTSPYETGTDVPLLSGIDGVRSPTLWTMDYGLTRFDHVTGNIPELAWSLHALAASGVPRVR